MTFPKRAWFWFESVLPLLWVVMAVVAIFTGDYAKAYGFLGVAAYFLVTFRLDRVIDEIGKLRKEIRGSN